MGNVVMISWTRSKKVHKDEINNNYLCFYEYINVHV